MHKTALCWMAALLLLCVLLGTQSCASDDAKPLDLGNAPIDLPEHVGYALSPTASGTYVAVIDLDSCEIVGIHAIGRSSEYAEDFAIAPNGNLFVPINSNHGTASNIIRVINPATGDVVDEIEVSWGPRMINTVPGGKAIVEHNLLPYGEDTYACDVIDMNTNTMLRSLRLEGLAGKVLHSQAGTSYIGIADVRGRYGGATLVEFDSQTNGLANESLTLAGDLNIWVAAFATESKLYVVTDSEEGEEQRYGVVGVFGFPSGDLLGMIQVAWRPRSIVVAGQKAYMIHFSGSNALEQRTLTVVDTTTDQVIKTLTVCPGPQDMAYSKATGRLYIASALQGTKEITVMDMATDEVTRTIFSDDERLKGFYRIKLAG